jgi:predicted nucleic acid-binding protein
LRGYRSAIAAGKPFQRQLQAFEGLVQVCVVLPVDDVAADVAATMWSGSTRKARQGLGDLLIAAVAVARQLPLVTRNRRDFETFAQVSGARLTLVDWTKPASRKS